MESAFGRYTLESLYATYEAVYNQMSSRQATLEEELARAEEQEKLKLVSSCTVIVVVGGIRSPQFACGACSCCFAGICRGGYCRREVL